MKEIIFLYKLAFSFVALLLSAIATICLYYTVVYSVAGDITNGIFINIIGITFAFMGLYIARIGDTISDKERINKEREGK